MTTLQKHLAIMCQNKQLPFIFEEAESLGVRITFFILRLRSIRDISRQLSGVFLFLSFKTKRLPWKSSKKQMKTTILTES